MINESVQQRLQRLAELLNDTSPRKTPRNWQVGVDLGTSDIVVVVVDEQGWPVAGFLQWAEVVKDGVVLNFWEAKEIVQDLVARAEQTLSITINKAVTSFPPGTDPELSANVLRAAGLEVANLIDEPSSVINLLAIREGAVVDIGGGTTGIAVAHKGQIVYQADEPTGGHHVTLTLAGNRKISLQEAEQLKRSRQALSYLPVVAPVFEKMAALVQDHLSSYAVDHVYLAGGTCLFPQMEKFFQDHLPDRKIHKPAQPLLLTPLAIASYGL